MRALRTTLLLTIAACSSTSVPNASDAGVDSKPDTATCACKDAYNIDKSPTGATLGQAWLAWRYTPTCGFSADTLDIATDAASFAIYADAAGVPGAALVAEVPSNLAADRPGFRRATFTATQLSSSQQVWIAIKANPGGIDSTTAPFASDGAKANYTGGGPGAWGPTDSSAPIIFEVRGKCN